MRGQNRTSEVERVWLAHTCQSCNRLKLIAQLSFHGSICSLYKQVVDTELRPSTASEFGPRNRWPGPWFDIQFAFDSSTAMNRIPARGAFRDLFRFWGCSSVGRAVALQAIGQEFESPQLQPSPCGLRLAGRHACNCCGLAGLPKRDYRTWRACPPKPGAKRPAEAGV